MNNKKNIDRLFQEKFKDFEVAPNDAVWSRINESLPNKKKKRRVIALWWQIGGVAAVIALLLTVGVNVFNSDGNNNQEFPIVNTDKTDTENNKGEEGLKTSTNSKQDELKNEVNKLKVVDSESDTKSIIEEQENISPKKDNVSNQLTSPNKIKLNAVANNSNKKEKAASSQKRNTLTTITNEDLSDKVAANTKSDNTTTKKSDGTTVLPKSEIKSAIKKTIEDNNTAVVDNTTSKKAESETSLNTEIKNKNSIEKAVDDTVFEDSKKQSLIEAIAESTDPIEKEEDKQNRWSIAPNVAPVYFSSLGEGSSMHKEFNENSKSSDVNMSFGLTGSYAISKKLKIRAGVNSVNLNYTTSDVFAYTGADAVARSSSAQMTNADVNHGVQNIDFKDGLQSVSFISAKMNRRESTADMFNVKVTGDIDQRFSFIEVPLELEYKVLDKKFGINVIGGFSTFFLNNNEVYADLDGVSTLIGEANNITSTSFSANFGLGLDYSLSEQWNINLEPTFKYQINTFNNTSGNFKPFIVGVYTGLSFKF